MWDTHTGELLYTLQHDHIVRAIAYPPYEADMIATGGMEKKLRIFDLADEKPQPSSPSPNAPLEPVTLHHGRAHEIGEGVHKEAIKFIVWTRVPTTLITAAGKTLRWFDIPSKSCIKEEVLGGEITSCELVSLAPSYAAATDIGGGQPVLAVASGKTVSFWGGETMTQELKRFTLDHGAASVGLDVKGRKFVVGEDPGTWVRVYTWEDGKEIGESRATVPRRGDASLTVPRRRTQGPPRTGLVGGLLARRQAVRDRLRRRHHQDVEELRRLLRTLARRSGHGLRAIVRVALALAERGKLRPSRRRRAGGHDVAGQQADVGG